MRQLILTIVILTGCPIIAYTQSNTNLKPTAFTQATPFPSPLPTSPAYGGQTTLSNGQTIGGRTTYETQLGWGILIFGFLTILLEVLVMLKLQKGWGTQSIRIVGLTLVLTSGLFLIVTGYSQDQIAPMIGLLGTITGFLLGRTTSV